VMLKKKSLKNFKIVGDNVECWWVIIGVAVGCGDKKECRKFVEELQNYGGWASGDRDDRLKRPGSRRGTSKWRATMVNMRLQSRMLNMRRMMPGGRPKGKATGGEIS
jgi:hypothetical protein